METTQQKLYLILYKRLHYMQHTLKHTPHKREHEHNINGIAYFALSSANFSNSPIHTSESIPFCLERCINDSKIAGTIYINAGCGCCVTILNVKARIKPMK